MTELKKYVDSDVHEVAPLQRRISRRGTIVSMQGMTPQSPPVDGLNKLCNQALGHLLGK